MFDFLLRLFFPQRSFAQAAGPPTVREDSIVVAYHPQLRKIGHAILDSGGNAFDAFVAVTVAQNVLAEGGSTLAGPLGVLVRTAADGRVRYLDADFNDPLDPDWRCPTEPPLDGRAVLVPGALAGLDALARTHGTRPLRELLQPSIRLAADGFPVTNLMAEFISWRADVLKRSEYGQRTFFTPKGRPLHRDQTLRQPEVAEFLTRFCDEGAGYVYAGDWGREFLSVVRAKGGVLTTADLEHYRVRWDQPWTATYRGYTLSSGSGRSFGGLWVLLALKTLEHMPIPPDCHYSEDPALLETLLRIAREMWAEEWLFDVRVLDDRALVESRLTDEYTRQIWERIAAQSFTESTQQPGSHSYHITVADRDGNVVSGTTTIESDPWGEGFFVQGIPLSTAGAIPFHTAPGQRRLCPFSIHFVFQDGRLQFAVGSFSNSIVEASFQFLVNLIDYRLPVESAVSVPRFGTRPVSYDLPLDPGRNWLDPRISRRIVRSLKKRGLRVRRDGSVDTGLGVLLDATRPDTLCGIAAPVPYIADPFSAEA